MKFTGITGIIFALILLPLAASGDTTEGEFDDLERRHGLWITMDDNEVMVAMVEYRHGKLHGTSRYGYPSGKQKFEQEFVNGLRDGAYTEFYDDEASTMLQQGQYKNDHQQGEWQSWHPNGQLSEKTNYFNGWEQGLTTHYFSTGEGDVGQIESELTYRTGELHGSAITYFDNDEHSIRTQGQYVSDQASGLWEERYPDGEIKSEITYVAGLKHGPARIFHSTGRLHFSTLYDRNELHGEFTQHFDNADHSLNYQGAHNSGKRDGRWKEWFENGNLNTETGYKYGQLDGVATFYHSYDGSLDYWQTFQNGVLDGAYIKYHFPKPIDQVSAPNSDPDTPDPKTANYKMEWGNHKGGKRDGEWHFLHPNGQTRSNGYYRDGIQSGTWLDYTEDGKLSTITEFSEGEMVNQQTDCHLETVYCDGE